MKITKSDKKRFWAKVDITNGCWNWKASTIGKGYGYFKANGKNVRAHRFIYTLVYGSIPDGLCICHHCDNPLCVRPSHLFMGTHKDNRRDAVAKGRYNNKGERNAKSKLVENDVHEIRRLYSLGVTKATLAKMWRVSNRHAGGIVRRETWGHI